MINTYRHTQTRNSTTWLHVPAFLQCWIESRENYSYMKSELAPNMGMCAGKNGKDKLCIYDLDHP